LVFGVIGAFVAFFSGLTLLIFSSDRAVKHSIAIASALKISPLIIGLTLVSLGTDLPEIINSIISCAMGHGDVNLGNSIGSVLSQLTLIFGFFPFIAGSFRIKRKEIGMIGGCLILALSLMLLLIKSDSTSRLVPFILVAIWPVLMLIIKRVKTATTEPTLEEELSNVTKIFDNLFVAIFGFIGVAIGSYIVIQSIVSLSSLLNVPEFITSFFILGVGTSLPELSVDFTALRKKRYELAVGDILGSCIIDATLSLGIGLLLFPTPISISIGEITGLYTLIVSIIVVSLIMLREKVDRITGVIFILLYLLTYAIIR